MRSQFRISLLVVAAATLVILVLMSGPSICGAGCGKDGTAVAVPRRRSQATADGGHRPRPVRDGHGLAEG